MILTAEKVMEKIKKENKDELVNYICPIFRLQHKPSTGAINEKCIQIIRCKAKNGYILYHWSLD